MKNLSPSLSPSTTSPDADVYQTYSFASTTGFNLAPSGKALGGKPFFTVAFTINQSALALHGKFTSFPADPTSGEPVHSGYDYWAYQNLPDRMSQIITDFRFTVDGATLGDGLYTAANSSAYYAKLGSYGVKTDLTTPVSSIHDGFGGLMAFCKDGASIYDLSIGFWDPCKVTELVAHSRVFFCMTVKSSTSLDVLATACGETKAAPESFNSMLGQDTMVPASRSKNPLDNAAALEA